MGVIHHFASLLVRMDAACFGVSCICTMKLDTIHDMYNCFFTLKTVFANLFFEEKEMVGRIVNGFRWQSQN